MPGENRSIIFIDDDETICELAVRALRDSHWEISCYIDYEEGVNAIRAKAPRLIILDQNMPKINGIEILKEMRKAGGVNSVPVLLTSSVESSPEVIDELKEMKAAFMNKDKIIDGSFPEVIGWFVKNIF